jgi:hypothetical protein
MAEYKNLIGLTVLPMVILAGIAANCLSRRLRDLFFFLLVVLTPMTQRLDVNFVSREWYRGTTRGFEFSLMDILSMSVFFSMLLRPHRGQSRWYWPAGLGFMFFFFLYACFSVTVSDPQLFGLFELSKMLRGIIVFLAAALFVRTRRELQLLVVALACAVCWQGGLALYQRYHDGTYRVGGIIGDPNSLSMYLCMVPPVFVAGITSNFPKWVKCVCAAAVLLGGVGVLLTISRTGVVAMVIVLAGSAIACTTFSQLTPKKIGIGLLAIIIATGIFAKAWNTIQARYKEVSLAEEYDTSSKSQGRGYYILIAKTIAADRWLGVGLNNWSYWVSNEYGPILGWHFVPYIGTENYPSDRVPSGRNNLDAAQAAPAHNLGALTLGELGIPGLIIFAFVWLRWFQMGASFLWNRISDPEYRMGIGFFFACWGIFLQSLTEWVYRQTPIFFTFNIIIGALASLYCLKRRKKRTQAEASHEEDYAVTQEFGTLSPEEI